MNLINVLILVFVFIQQTIGLVSDEISILILSQKNRYHSGIAEHLKQNIIEQSLNIKENEIPTIYLSHEVFKKESSWAITPILIDIFKYLITPKTKWFILCDSFSMINLKSLLINLDKEDYKNELFLGHGLYDREATIIHHFAFFQNPSSFMYPYVRAGVAFSIPLLNRLVDYWVSSSVASSPPTSLHSTDFFIDPQHELSYFLWNIDNKLKLKSVPYFCNKYRDNCSIYARNENIFCGNPVSFDKILFAVKTCAKFHNERLPVILKTWAQYTFHLRMFSDVEDSSIPTVTTGVHNTDSGHCEKTMKILKLVVDEISRNNTLRNIEWVVLADDDTLLSVSALSEYLGCFNKKDHIYLGERYGYNLFNEDGFNYITGGGSIVFSLKTLKTTAKKCSCPAANSPDDMVLAACLKNVGVEPIHSSLYHQARPNDYPADTLDDNSISFHKFWKIDPFSIYDKMFHQRDKKYYKLNKEILADCKNSDKRINQKRNQKITHVDL